MHKVTPEMFDAAYAAYERGSVHTAALDAALRAALALLPEPDDADTADRLNTEHEEAAKSAT